MIREAPSYQFYISRATPHTPSPHRTPPHNPDIPPLHLKPPVRSFHEYFPYITQRSDEDRFILVRLVNHAYATRRIIEPLQRRRELREERGRVVRGEERLMRGQVLVFGWGEEGRGRFERSRM